MAEPARRGGASRSTPRRRAEPSAPPDVVATLAERHRLAGEARPLLYAARGASGPRWYFDERLGRNRLVDVYAENLPEALMAWAKANGRQVYVVYTGAPPAFDATHPSYSELYPDTVRELSTAEVPALMRARRNTITKDYSRHYEALLADESLRELFRIDGVDLFDTLLDQVRVTPGLASSYAVNCEVWQALLEALEPAVVFGGRLDVRPEVCGPARALGIMTVAIKLGIGEEMLAPFAMNDGEGRFQSATFPDVLGVWGEAQRKMVAERFPGCTAHIIACGRTRNDTFADHMGEDASETDTAPAPAATASDADGASALRTRLGLSPSTKVIVYGANLMTKFGQVAGFDYGSPCMSLGNYEGYLRALVSLAERRGDAAVIVKPHPSDDLQALERIVDAIASPACLLVTDAMGFHNAQLLAQAAVFVSSVTSMFAEAVLSGAVPINLWTPEVNYLYESQRRDVFSAISLAVTEPDDMVAIADQTFDDPAFAQRTLERLRMGLPDIFGARDGRNALRLVEASMAYHTTWLEGAGR